MSAFDDGLAAGRLVVGVCDACSRDGGNGGGGLSAPAYRAWPPGAGACPRCLGPVRPARLPPCGRIVEFSHTADGSPFCLAEFAHGVRLLGMLLAPRGGEGGGAGRAAAASPAPAGRRGPSHPSDPARFVPRVSQRVTLESCSLGEDGRPRYVMRAAGCGGGGSAWPPHAALGRP